jgi:hypothetical protein
MQYCRPDKSRPGEKKTRWVVILNAHLQYCIIILFVQPTVLHLQYCVCPAYSIAFVRQYCICPAYSIAFVRQYCICPAYSIAFVWPTVLHLSDLQYCVFVQCLSDLQYCICPDYSIAPTVYGFSRTNHIFFTLPHKKCHLGSF